MNVIRHVLQLVMFINKPIWNWWLLFFLGGWGRDWCIISSTICTRRIKIFVTAQEMINPEEKRQVFTPWFCCQSSKLSWNTFLASSSLKDKYVFCYGYILTAPSVVEMDGQLVHRIKIYMQYWKMLDFVALWRGSRKLERK